MDIEWLDDVPGAVRLTRVDWAVPTSQLTSRIVARVRLQDIIRCDREACGDGRWVRKTWFGPGDWIYGAVNFYRFKALGMIDGAEVWRNFGKNVYRWEPRR